MLYNQTAYLMVAERHAELQRTGWRNRLNRVYPDRERQPKILKHWANR